MQIVKKIFNSIFGTNEQTKFELKILDEIFWSDEEIIRINSPLPSFVDDFKIRGIIKTIRLAKYEMYQHLLSGQDRINIQQVKNKYPGLSNKTYNRIAGHVAYGIAYGSGSGPKPYRD